MKKTLKILLIIFSAQLILFIVCCLSSCFSTKLYTQDINDYNIGDFDLDAYELFVSEIPQNAQPVDFRYYKEFDVIDIYLELKFSSIEELNAYISKIKGQVNERLKNLTSPLGDDWFIEKSNPHDSKYVELFLVSKCWYSNNMRQTGYKFDCYDDGEYAISCTFGMLSYSLEDLTVIQTMPYGTFDSYLDYVPKYFERFNIPIDSAYNRVYIIEIVENGTF